MNNGMVIFFGVLLTILCSWSGLIVKNFREIGRQEPEKLVTGESYPGGRSGTANFGQEVYRANGCASCHTMQVRAKGYGRDVERGWGPRNSVLQDFVYDRHVFLGQVRVGPDLSGIGNRRPDTTWHLQHLYNPRITVPGSMMPQYPYLFEKRKIKGQLSANALPVPDTFREQGYEIVPTREAVALVEYLVSLKNDFPIFEAPLIDLDRQGRPIPPAKPKTNQVENAATQNQAVVRAVRGIATTETKQ